MNLEEISLQRQFFFSDRVWLFSKSTSAYVAVTKKVYKRLLWLYVFNAYVHNNDSFFYTMLESTAKKGPNSVASFVFDCLNKKVNEMPNVKEILFTNQMQQQGQIRIKPYDDVIFLGCPNIWRRGPTGKKLLSLTFWKLWIQSELSYKSSVNLNTKVMEHWLPFLLTAVYFAHHSSSWPVT